MGGPSGSFEFTGGGELFGVEVAGDLSNTIGETINLNAGSWLDSGAYDLVDNNLDFSVSCWLCAAYLLAQLLLSKSLKLCIDWFLACRTPVLRSLERGVPTLLGVCKRVLLLDPQDKPVVELLDVTECEGGPLGVVGASFFANSPRAAHSFQCNANGLKLSSTEPWHWVLLSSLGQNCLSGEFEPKNNFH